MGTNSIKASPISSPKRTVKTILVSQPKPERSPYYDIEKKYAIQIDWRPFNHVEPVTEKDFRKNRIRPDEFQAVVMTSKNSIDHFFRPCEEMRVKVSQDMKYFCTSETVAHYLQKFIQYRKRKVFVGERSIQDLSNALQKHKSTTRFLVPCSNLGKEDVIDYLKQKEVNFESAVMYNSVSSDLSDLRDIFYDMLIFFSPQGIESLFENFPDFKQNNTRIGVFGNITAKAAEDHQLHIDVLAPAPGIPSMSMALEKYLQESNKQ
jgi:uroporphyrinogen-III synthase